MSGRAANALLPRVLATSLVAVLAACGGGSDDVAAPSPTSPAQPVPAPSPEPAPDPSPPPLPPPDLTPPPADPTPVAPAEEACADWEELREARYVYKNNVWNKGAITGYEQCVMRRVVDGEDQYGWRWRWPSQSPAVAAQSPIASYHRPNHEVRAYPEVVHGKGPWDTQSTMSNFPLQVSQVSQIRVDYEAYLTVEGDYNLAFSMWLTSDTPGTPEGVSHEIMIWVDRTDWAPGGPEDHVAEVEIDGSEYAVFVRQNADDPDAHASLVGQKYIAFAKYTDQFSGTLNFEKFLDYLVEHDHIPDDHYVNNVELGNEVLDGSSGEFWLKSLDVQVR